MLKKVEVFIRGLRVLSIAAKAEYWQRVRKACDKHGAVLIMDEIPNSLGR
jgi:4-aminobutyrate aminotransferase